MTPNPSLTVCASSGISASILKSVKGTARTLPSERRIGR